MRETLTTAVSLVAMAAAFAAVAAGGTHSAAQRMRIEVTGADPYAFVLKPISHGRVQPDTGSAKFCCWRTWSVTRAGAKLDVSNPRMTLAGTQGALKIGARVEWVALPDDWSVCTGTWKVTGGTGAYAALSGHGRLACAWGPDNGPLRIRLFGFLEPK